MSGDSWLLEYDACARQGQEVMEHIMDRNRQQKGSSAYTKQTAHVRTSMREFSRDVASLREDLIRSARISSVTQRELDRRQAMMDQLLTKEKQLEDAFHNENRNDFGQRSGLLPASTNPFDTPVSTNPFDEPNDPWNSSSQDPSTVSVDEIRQQQQQAIREQDQGLEALSSVIGRQKQMALDIGNEVEGQNELIDDITDHTDHTNTRLIRETRHIRIIDRKSSTCCMWVIIIMLAISIVVIAVVPYNGKP